MSEEIKIGQFKVRDRRNKEFFLLDNVYLNGYAKHFGPVGTAIYISLCRHADNNEQKCYPSQELMAEELSIGTTTIKKYLKLLEQCHLIYIEKQRDEKTQKYLGNTYWLLDKTEWIKPGSPSVYGSPETLGCKSQGRQVSNNNTHTNNTHIYIARIESFFKNPDSAWLNELKKAFPAANLETEFPKMKIWLISNQDKQKKNIKRFAVNWLSRAKLIPNSAIRPGIGDTILSEEFLEKELGKIATKDMLKKIMLKTPQNTWWLIERFLRKRYPGDTGRVFMEAEKETIEELRKNQENFSELVHSIGK
ncbi:MAG: helix-turn-helix domain-containing protein [Candidatus Omnitrophica bacterium]|nr:helix-turn-helix domain-containing protein [Candidatus Omnitrophota bacterium]